MTYINDIPVHVESGTINDDNGMVAAVLNEIFQLLKAYIDTYEEAAIDVKSLPLSDNGYRQLKQQLGVGEVTAVAQLSGDTEVYETAYAGVWWVTHRNIDDKIIADHIQVTGIPSILCSHVEDMKQSVKRMEGTQQ